MCLEGRYSTGTQEGIPLKGTLQLLGADERVRVKAGRNGKEHSRCLQRYLESSEARRSCQILETVRVKMHQKRIRTKQVEGSYFDGRLSSHTEVSQLESLELS